MYPQKINSGKYNTVFSGKMAATLLQTFFSVFSAEKVQQGLSLFTDKKNTSIASQCVTLIDNPFYKNSVFQMPFDSEGTPSYTKNIIENGILKTYLYDSRAASKDQVESTGNALRLSYSSPITIMPYNFYFEPSTDSLETLFSNLKHGLYITELQGMQSGSNPNTGDFSLAANGYIIRDGKKSTPVNEFTISGNFYSLLKQIKLVGSDISFLMPKGCSCFGSPSLLIENLSVAGK